MEGDTEGDIEGDIKGVMEEDSLCGSGRGGF